MTGYAMDEAFGDSMFYIATCLVAKHRIFIWLHRRIVPENVVIVIARDDDTTFGILHFRIHEIWSLANSSRHGVGNDPIYNAVSCFETFPYPEGLTPDILAEQYADDPHARAIAAVYGWPVELSEQEVLGRLLGLNLERKNE